MTIRSLLLAAGFAAASLAFSPVADAQALGGGLRVGKPRPAEDGQGTDLRNPPMPPDTVLAESDGIRITRADYDVELQRLPPNMRGGFATSERRVADLLTRMLLARKLAAQADSSGIMADPLMQARLAAETERFKAQVMILHIESEAAKRFDADRGRWDARARDVYLTETKRFETPEYREVQVLPLRASKRGGHEAALKQARLLRERWVAGESWAKLAPDSDAGGIGPDEKPERYRKSDLPSEVADKVFALPDAAISEPLVAGDDVFVFRIVGRIASTRPAFDQVKAQIMNELKQKYIDGERDRILGEQGEAARAGINPEALDKMVLHLEPGQLERLQREAMEKARAKGKN